MEGPLSVAKQFCVQGQVLTVEPFGEGNVNDTYLVTMTGGQEDYLVLQRINTHVFPHPQWIMSNLRIFGEHVQARLAHEPSRRRWVVPYVQPTVDGADGFRDTDGGYWRALSHVANSFCHQRVQSSSNAHEVGYALGRFHSLTSDLDVGRLRDTLPGFHIAPAYLAHYDQVLARLDGGEDPALVAYGKAFVAARRAWVPVLEEAKARGELRQRPIHGDPKVNNIMLDCETEQAVSLVDLDTVKPGLVHYDIGDCLRSCCNPLGEETTDFDEVRFDLDLARSILEGYLDQARPFLTASDYAYMYDCVRLIAFELGLRFFTDYLERDVYFKVRHREHNLHRAVVQFRLTESIEAQEDEIRAVIRSCVDK